MLTGPLTRKRTAPVGSGGQVKRDPFAYEAKYTEDNVVGIFTRADLEMVNAKNLLKSQDL